MRNLILVLLGCLGVAGGVVVATRAERPAEPERRPPQPHGSLLDLQGAFNDVAGYVAPSIVHLTTATRSVGSGVIVSSGGLVLTNNHVVQGSPRLSVMLYDGRSFDAIPRGADPETDLALLEIQNPPANLVAATLGDSDEVRVGDLVLAVGSPFGLHHTVTSGIISGKSRRARLTTYEDFLQTDAAINPGNSGGALVNLRGQVIGINTAIVVERPGAAPRNAGVGFAIPINLARWVVERIQRDGRVRRGFVGIGVQDWNADLVSEFQFHSLAHALRELGVREPVGCVITRVWPGTPAERAKLEPGDIVVSYAGQRVQNSTDLLFKVARTEPDTAVSMTVLRNGREREVTLTVIERPSDLKK